MLSVHSYYSTVVADVIRVVFKTCDYSSVLKSIKYDRTIVIRIYYIVLIRCAIFIVLFYCFNSIYCAGDEIEKHEMGVACGACWEGRVAYSFLVGKPEGKRPLGSYGPRWEDDIKMDLREVGWGYGLN
jgi:hypothetical protein